MKLFIVLVVAVLLPIGSPSLISAQAVSQPGQLRGLFQTRAIQDGNRYSATVLPKTTIATINEGGRHERIVNRVWIAGMVSAVAGTGLDAFSSWGLREGNGLLASSDGRFGTKGLALKTGLAAALIVPQIILRKRNALKVPFAIGDFAQAAVYSGVSVHNFQVRNSSKSSSN